MKLNTTVTLFFLFLFQYSPAFSANSSYSWDSPQPVSQNSVFFGEKNNTALELADKPAPGDKSYPWYLLEKGNNHFLKKEYDKALIYYRQSYSAGGPTRVLSGFKLVETMEKAGQVDSALDTLEHLEKNYLVSPREFQEAKSFRMNLEDLKRKGVIQKKEPLMTGREWVMQLSAWRIRYVLEAMENLSKHDIPLKESYQKYIFLLDEFFLAHPEASASDSSLVLADLVYELDLDARIPIDRWRRESLTSAAQSQEKGVFSNSNQVFPARFTGAHWITMVHNDKLAYISEAMGILKQQGVPMEKTLYGYTDAVDKLFTENPEFPAGNSVIALASYLYQAEPEARKVLEALRLE